MISPFELIAAGRSLVGVPYVHQGHSVHGVDCIGFVFTAAEIAGVNIASHMSLGPEKLPAWNYSRGPQSLGLDRTQRWLKQIAGPIPGCIVFFQFPGTNHPSHFAIYTGVSIIHALSREGKVTEQSFGEPWIRWTHSFWEVPGVAYV